MPSQDHINQVQRVYIAYYGRPADSAGLDYWSTELEAKGGDLSGIIDAFGNSPEFQSRFGQLQNQQLVENIYQFLFNRSADPDGLDFYVQNLTDGGMSLGTIALNILDGAQNDDLAVVDNKFYGASKFTAISSLYKLQYGSDQIDSAKLFLDGILKDTSQTDIVTKLVNSTLQQFPASNIIVEGTAENDTLDTTQEKDTLSGKGGSDTFNIFDTPFESWTAVDVPVNIPQMDEILDYAADDKLSFDNGSDDITSSIVVAQSAPGVDSSITATVKDGLVEFVTGEDGLDFAAKLDFVFHLIDSNSVALLKHEDSTYVVQDYEGELSQVIKLVGTNMTELSYTQDNDSTVVLLV